MMFNGIDKSESDNLKLFFQQKKISVQIIKEVNEAVDGDEYELEHNSAENESNEYKKDGFLKGDHSEDDEDDDDFNPNEFKNTKKE